MEKDSLSPFAELTLTTTPTVSIPVRKLSWSLDSSSSTPRRECSKRTCSPLRMKLSARGNLIRRMNSAPSPTTLAFADTSGKENAFLSPRSPAKVRLSAVDDQDTTSQDSGCSEDAAADIRFVVPSGFAPRRTVEPSPGKVWCEEDAVSPLGCRSKSFASPSRRSASSLRSLSFCSTDSFDDGFSELADLDKPDGASPAALASLLTGQLLPMKENEVSEDKSTPTFSRLPIRRAFSMVENQMDTQSSPKDSKLVYKRPRELASIGGLYKRRKPDASRHKLQRSASESAAVALSSKLNNAYGRSDLIADFSCSYVLPIIPGKHTDLTSITAETLAAVLKGDFNSSVKSYTIIDCRYPYEFEGGHIKGAINLYTCEQIETTLLRNDSLPTTDAQGDPSGRNILIFHCEFSQARGPSMYRWLRRLDRNRSNYPSLKYPEVYLLHGGYQTFFESHADLCEPNGYRPMQDPNYEADLRKFRTRSSSWSVSRASLKRLQLL